MDKNICLIGYMGSGKTTVGRMLAERFDMDFEDTDELIVKNEGRSIPDIFRDEGEAYFRRLETDLMKKLASDGDLKSSAKNSLNKFRQNDAVERTVPHCRWQSSQLFRLSTSYRSSRHW